MIHVFHEEITSTMLSFVYNSSLYKKSSIEECDFIIYNHILWAEQELDTENTLKALSEKYRSIGKLVIIFIVSDYQRQYTSYGNIITLRTSLKASLKKNNELVMPYIWECASEPFSPIVHQSKAHIGFCGLGSKHRKAILKVFSQSSLVVDNFVIRDKFWGGNPHNSELIDTFQTNLKENAFTISQRGNGNFSMRFYQTLAAGRIPVLVNTDMILPFSDKIEWEKYVVFEKDEKTCLKKVLNMYESGQYIKMQEDCGNIFNCYFTENLFLEQLINQIYRQLDSNKKNENNFINTVQKAFRQLIT